MKYCNRLFKKRRHEKKIAPITASITKDDVNAIIIEHINHRKKILEKKDEHAYDEEIRKIFKLKFSESLLKKRREIVFGR